MHTSASPAAPKHRLRWFQYRLSSLFILMTAVSVALSAYMTYVVPYRAQQRAARILAGRGGEISTRPAGPFWLKWIVGEDPVEVVFIKLEHSQVTDDDLECLADLPQVERLYLADTKASDRTMVHVGRLKHLKRLSLWRTAITDRGIEFLRGIRNVEALDVHENGHITDSAMSHVRELENLRFLSIAETSVTDSGLQKLGDLPRLALLDISNSAVTEAGLIRISGLPSLRELRLTTPLGDPGIAWLAARPKLACRALCACGVTDRGMADLGKLTSLYALELSESPDVSEEAYSHLVALRSLKTLTITTAGPSDGALTHLMRMPRTETWVTAYCGTFAGIAQALGGKTEELTLHSGDTYDGGATQFYNVACLARDFNIHVFLPRHGFDLAILKEFSNVRALSLEHHFCDDDLLPALELPHLTELELGFWLTDAGLAHVARIKGLRKLTIRPNQSGGRVPKMQVSPDGLAQLGALPHLEELHLSSVPVRDGHIEVISTFPHLKRLKVDHAGNKPAAAWDQLLRAVPAAEWEWGSPFGYDDDP